MNSTLLKLLHIIKVNKRNVALNVFGECHKRVVCKNYLHKFNYFFYPYLQFWKEVPININQYL
jgi:hypothetical protein